MFSAETSARKIIALLACTQKKEENRTRETKRAHRIFSIEMYANCELNTKERFIEIGRESDLQCNVLKKKK